MLRVPLLVLVAALAGCVRPAPPAVTASPTPAAAVTPQSATALAEAIRARHGATWYRTMAFVQATTFYGPDGATREQTWYEAAALPGRLRIDVAPLGEGNTSLVVADSTFIAQGGRVVQRRGEGNPLLLFGFDAVFLPAAETVAGMARLGIDTSAVRVDTWQGRDAVVVGGAPGDEASPQVWFDRERLVFVRLVERNGMAVQDIRFNEYAPLDGGWIAPHVEIYSDRRLVMEERYRAVRTGVTLPARTFDPRVWPSVDWWTAAGYDGTE